MNYAASGIGAVAGPMLAPWQARRGAQARLIFAQAEADSIRIVADAQAAARSIFADGADVQGHLEMSPEGITQRIDYQERKRQANIAAVVRGAARELEDKEVAQHEPDHDWAARFFSSVQDVSSEDMRRIWARILAGEVEKPGFMSLRTLSTLRNLAASEANAFSKVAKYRIGNLVFPDPLTMYDGDTVPLLVEVGLIRSDSQEPLKSDGGKVICREPRCVLVVEARPSKPIGLRGYEFTRPGKEIAQCIEPVPDMQFLERIARSLEVNGITLKIATEVFGSAHGELCYNPDDLRVI